VDGHRVEFGFAANLAAEKVFFRQIFNIKTANIKLKTHNFNTDVFEATY